MILYITIIIYFSCLAFTDYIKIPTPYKTLFLFVGAVISFCLLWLPASLRWRTGTDWESYHDAFFYYSEVYSGYFEPGFTLLLSSIRSVTANYSVFLAIFSFLCISTKFYFFLRYNAEIFYTVILLFFCYYFGDIFAVRQNLAISLTILSVVFIIKRRPLLFLITVVIATSIHVSSILFLFAYFFFHSKVSNKVYYFFIVFSIIFGFVGGGGIALSFLLKLTGVGGYAGEKIAQYLSGNEGVAINTNNDPIVLYILGLIKRCLLIPIFIYIKGNIKKEGWNFEGYFNLYMVGNIIYFLFAKDMAIFARASVPFLFFEILLIGYSLKFFQTKSFNILVICFIFVLLLATSRFNALLNSYYNLYVPYNSIFDEQIDRVLE